MAEEAPDNTKTVVSAVRFGHSGEACSSSNGPQIPLRERSGK